MQAEGEAQDLRRRLEVAQEQLAEYAAQRVCARTLLARCQTRPSDHESSEVHDGIVQDSRIWSFLHMSWDMRQEQNSNFAAVQ